MGLVNRRSFLVGATLLAANSFSSIHAKAIQHAKVGILASGPNGSLIALDLWIPELANRGWIEGRNLTVYWRFANGSQERLAEHAAELVKIVDVVIAQTNVEAEAIRRLSRAVPIVVVFATEPVKSGLARTLSHPGSNTTGTIFGDAAFSAKSIQILKEVLPKMERIGFIYLKDRAEVQPFLIATEEAADALGIRHYRLPVGASADVDVALETAKKERVDALRIIPQAAIAVRLEDILQFARLHKIATSFSTPRAVELGGLMSYSPSAKEMVSRDVALVDRVLRGEIPADLPFEYLRQFELVINLKMAKAIGLNVPQSILSRADRLID